MLTLQEVCREWQVQGSHQDQRQVGQPRPVRHPVVRGHQEEQERPEPHEQDDLPRLLQRSGARVRDGAGEGVEEETPRAC